MARRVPPADPAAVVREDTGAGPLMPIYLIQGAEQFLARRAFDALFAASVAGGPRGFNEQVFQAERASGSAIASACNHLPMMGPRRTVVVRNTERLKQTDQDELGEYCARPSATTVLLLLVSADSDKKIDGRRKLAKSIKANGRILDFKRIYGRSLHSWIEAEAKARGKRLDSRGPGYIEAIVGNDLAQIDNCLEHASLYVGDADTISMDDLAIVVSGRRQDALWDLLDAVGERSLSDALRNLQLLYLDGSKPEAIHALLSRRLRELKRGTELVESGTPVRDAVMQAGMPPNMAWKLEKQLRTYRSQELQAGISRLLTTESDLKGGRRIDKRWALEQAVLGIIQG